MNSNCQVNQFVLLNEDMYKTCEELFVLLRDNMSEPSYSPNSGIVLQIMESRIARLGMMSYGDYFSYVKKDRNGKKEISEIRYELEKIKSSFFRGIYQFEYMKKEVFSQTEFKNRKINIMSAGCSTGEEAYTLAMICEETMKKDMLFDYEIFSEDIVSSAIYFASKGVYENNIFDSVPMNMIKNYFMAGNGEYEGKFRIVPEMRKKIKFACWDIREKENSEILYDVIFCRDVLKFYNEGDRLKIIENLNYNLSPNGFLFLSSDEDLSGNLFNLEKTISSVYKKME